MTNDNGTNKDRRREPRFMTNGRGHVTALGAPTSGKYAAIIVDVSRSGLQLALETPLPAGIKVKVEFNELIVVGEVLNQGLHEAGRYRIGVQVREIAESHDAMRDEARRRLSACSRFQLPDQPSTAPSTTPGQA